MGALYRMDGSHSLSTSYFGGKSFHGNREQLEIQMKCGYYRYNHLVSPLAEQLYSLIKDFDVCLMVAKNYIQMRAHDSTEISREFYMSKIWEEKPGLDIPRAPGSLGALAKRLHLWNPDYILLKYASRTFPPLESRISKKTLQYLASPRGMRARRSWRFYASLWGVKNLDKENITLRDKLDDLNYIPERFITGRHHGGWIENVCY